uniref:NADH dehydrogenase subunit 4L n=1 Tax=Microcotyle sebastis TaxID=116890 RepID=A3QRH8_MICSE|nr:NADH dehydrogenase subunit 4L [Microcotyle sebastis]
MFSSAFFCFVFILISLIFVFGSFLNLLIMLENINILFLFSCVFNTYGGNLHTIFIMLLVLMTMEVSVGLVLVCCLWNINSLNDIFIL